MIIEVKQIESTLSLVIITLSPSKDVPNYRALLARHGRITATYKDIGAVVIYEKRVES
jgi:hypothetical protein